MSTEFLASLSVASRDDMQTRICDFFLFVNKKIAKPDKACLGWIAPDGDSGPRMYYYRLDDGVLEIEVVGPTDGTFSRRVTDFITDPEELRVMLGELYAPSHDGSG